jgi:16S rRNA (uracil1498-N3)-methyltransferase
MDAGDDHVTLPKDEAEHLIRVLRLGVGDTVAVFDGRGREFMARVTTAVRRDVRVRASS